MEVVPDSLTLHSTVSGPVFQQQFFCLYFLIFFSDEKELLGSNLGMEQIDLFSINGRKKTHPSLPPEKKPKTNNKTNSNMKTRKQSKTKKKNLTGTCL